MPKKGHPANENRAAAMRLKLRNKVNEKTDGELKISYTQNGDLIIPDEDIVKMLEKVKEEQQILDTANTLKGAAESLKSSADGICKKAEKKNKSQTTTLFPLEACEPYLHAKAHLVLCRAFIKKAIDLKKIKNSKNLDILCGYLKNCGELLHEIENKLPKKQPDSKDTNSQVSGISQTSQETNKTPSSGENTNAPTFAAQQVNAKFVQTVQANGTGSTSELKAAQQPKTPPAQTVPANGTGETKADSQLSSVSVPENESNTTATTAETALLHLNKAMACYTAGVMYASNETTKDKALEQFQNGLLYAGSAKNYFIAYQSDEDQQNYAKVCAVERDLWVQIKEHAQPEQFVNLNGIPALRLEIPQQHGLPAIGGNLFNVTVNDAKGEDKLLGPEGVLFQAIVLINTGDANFAQGNYAGAAMLYEGAMAKVNARISALKKQDMEDPKVANEYNTHLRFCSKSAYFLYQLYKLPHVNKSKEAKNSLINAFECLNDITNKNDNDKQSMSKLRRELAIENAAGISSASKPREQAQDVGEQKDETPVIFKLLEQKAVSFCNETNRELLVQANTASNNIKKNPEDTAAFFARAEAYLQCHEHFKKYGWTELASFFFITQAEKDFVTAKHLNAKKPVRKKQFIQKMAGKLEVGRRELVDVYATKTSPTILRGTQDVEQEVNQLIQEGRKNFDQKNVAACITSFESAHKKLGNPKSVSTEANLYFEFALLCKQHGNFLLAFKFFAIVTLIRPMQVKAHYQRALLYLEFAKDLHAQEFYHLEEVALNECNNLLQVALEIQKVLEIGKDKENAILTIEEKADAEKRVNQFQAKQQAELVAPEQKQEKQKKKKKPKIATLQTANSKVAPKSTQLSKADREKAEKETKTQAQLIDRIKGLEQAVIRFLARGDFDKAKFRIKAAEEDIRLLTNQNLKLEFQIIFQAHQNSFNEQMRVKEMDDLLLKAETFLAKNEFSEAEAAFLEAQKFEGDLISDRNKDRIKNGFATITEQKKVNKCLTALAQADGLYTQACLDTSLNDKKFAPVRSAYEQAQNLAREVKDQNNPIIIEKLKFITQQFEAIAKHEDTIKTTIRRHFEIRPLATAVDILIEIDRLATETKEDVNPQFLAVLQQRMVNPQNLSHKNFAESKDCLGLIPKLITNPRAFEILIKMPTLLSLIFPEVNCAYNDIEKTRNATVHKQMLVLAKNHLNDFYQASALILAAVRLSTILALDPEIAGNEIFANVLSCQTAKLLQTCAPKQTEQKTETQGPEVQSPNDWKNQTRQHFVSPLKVLAPLKYDSSKFKYKKPENPLAGAGPNNTQPANGYVPMHQQPVDQYTHPAYSGGVVYANPAMMPMGRGYPRQPVYYPGYPQQNGFPVNGFAHNGAQGQQPQDNDQGQGRGRVPTVIKP